ncbi:MAG: zinc ribbon domain-containing protein [Methanomassiliicoccales archaeon]
MKDKSDQIECPICSRQIAADARTCPYCGAEFESHDLVELEQLAEELVREGSVVAMDQQTFSSTEQVSPLSVEAPSGSHVGVSGTKIENRRPQFSNANQGGSVQSSEEQTRKERKGIFGRFKFRKN